MAIPVSIMFNICIDNPNREKVEQSIYSFESFGNISWKFSHNNNRTEFIISHNWLFYYFQSQSIFLQDTPFSEAKYVLFYGNDFFLLLTINYLRQMSGMWNQLKLFTKGVIKGPWRYENWTSSVKQTLKIITFVEKYIITVQYDMKYNKLRTSISKILI